MRAILATTDPVLLSFAQSVLTDSGIVSHVADQYLSAVEGSMAIFPRRLLVLSDDFAEAWKALSDAGLGHELAARDSGNSQTATRKPSDTSDDPAGQPA